MTDAEQGSNQLIALRIDFVAKPGNGLQVATGIAKLLEQAGLHEEGLQASMLLVSDREARVVTLLTLWNGERFGAARDRLTSWTVKLVARVADGTPRACTSMTHVLLPQASSKLTLSDLRPTELAELVEIITAG
jgi:hypothetical protein